MSKKVVREEIFEYKIEYTEANSELVSEKHFSACDVNIAIEMFNFACKKDELSAKVEKIAVWNRWANRWDPVEEKID